MENTHKAGKLIKLRIADEYSKRFKGSSSILITDFGGLKDKELKDLRKRLRQVSGKYLIVKNSMCRMALEKMGIGSISGLVGGACAVGYGKGDPVSLSKTLVDFSKENKNLKLIGGYVDGLAVSPDVIKEIAALPGKEVLVARLLSCLNSPISGLVSTCSGIVKKLLYALNDIIKNKEKNGQ